MRHEDAVPAREVCRLGRYSCKALGRETGRLSLPGKGTHRMLMAPGETRREANQRTSRRGNERLHEVVATKIPEGETIRFLCECADAECLASVEVKPHQWKAVAAQPDHFLIVPGHMRSEGEDVVGSLGRYEIVRKPNGRG